MTVAAVILAAGQSSRFEEGHKLLAEIGGIPVIRHVCTALAASHVDDIALITSESRGAIAKAAGPGRWRTVENADARHRLSESLRTGLKSVGDAAGVLVALGDMPGITTQLVNTLIAAFQSKPDAIVFPVANDGRRGHPVIWPKALLPSLMNVSGDTGGKAILAAHFELWLPVPWDDERAFADIDTRADLQNFTTGGHPIRRK